MLYWQCKCGNRRGFGSMGPRPCDWCAKCDSNPAFGPGSHEPQRGRHQLVKEKVETDEGVKVLSVCMHCLKTRKQIVADGEPFDE